MGMFSRKSWYDKAKENEPTDPWEKVHYWNRLSQEMTEKSTKYGKISFYAFVVAFVCQSVFILMQLGVIPS